MLIHLLSKKITAFSGPAFSVLYRNAQLTDWSRLHTLFWTPPEDSWVYFNMQNFYIKCCCLFYHWELHRLLFLKNNNNEPQIPSVLLSQMRCKCHLLAYLKKFNMNLKVSQKLLRVYVTTPKPLRLALGRRGDVLHKHLLDTSVFFTAFHPTNAHINELCWNKICCQQHHMMSVHTGRLSPQNKHSNWSLSVRNQT